MCGVEIRRSFTVLSERFEIIVTVYDSLFQIIIDIIDIIVKM